MIVKCKTLDDVKFKLYYILNQKRKVNKNRILIWNCMTQANSIEWDRFLSIKRPEVHECYDLLSPEKKP